MTPQFRITKIGRFWSVDVYYISSSEQRGFFTDWDGFEEPFSEKTYQSMTKWCYDTFKTYIHPKRVRRMGYTQYYFENKKDLDWFVMYWSGVDILDD